MKQFVSLILALVLCFSLACCSYAESEFNLDNMSIDELLELNAAIKSKIAEKLKDIDQPYKIIPAGRYNAVIDIAVGSYEISPVEETCDWQCAIRDDSNPQGWRFYGEEIIEPGSYLRIPVEENSCFNITTACYIRKSEVINFD